jgi:hypothetical protein
VVAVLHPPALEAHDFSERAMQLDHLPAAGLRVEAIHVLGDHLLDHADRFEPRDRGVRGAGQRLAEARPADHGARPVAPPQRRRADELRPLDRPTWPRERLGAPVVGYARLGADAGAREHDSAPSAQMAGEDVEGIVGQRFVVHARGA